MGSEVSFHAVSFEKLRAAWRGDRSWSAAGRTLLELCNAMGRNVSSDLLRWNFFPHLSETLTAHFGKHGAVLPLDFDPTIDAPVSLPKQDGWPNASFLSAARVQDVVKQMRASLKRPLPEVESQLALYRRVARDVERREALDAIEELLRWNPEAELLHFLIPVRAGASDDYLRELLEHATDPILDARDQLDLASPYESAPSGGLDWRLHVSAKAMLELLEAAASTREGIVIVGTG